MEKIKNGIYKLTFGTPDRFTPVKIGGQELLPALNDLPDISCAFADGGISFKLTKRGVLAEYGMAEGEDFYGLGLLLKGFCHTGTKKTLRVNADPRMNTGDSHAPVPFFISTKNYGIIVDTLRETTFSFGNNVRKSDKRAVKAEENKIILNAEDLYAEQRVKNGRVIAIEIPFVKGVDIYIINGADMLDVISRFNLFFGGGAMPSLWGLGVQYRAYGQAGEKDILRLAASIRKDKMPCDCLGLEPGWQTRCYSNTFVISRERFPNFENVVKKLRADNFHVNLWEHAFTHPESPLYAELYKYAADFEVWNGLTPDFSIDECVKIFSDYHQKHLLDIGIDGIKLDEVDNSDFTGGWSFPHYAEFPGGMDGEQMHAMFGQLYARVFHRLFKKNNIRHFSQCRSNWLGSPPYAFVVASDLYEYKDFLTGVANAGFSGLLWSPEVRQCESEEELIRRIELIAFSQFACLNSWMVPNELWKQYEESKNAAGEWLADHERVTARCREALEDRMRLLPYIYAQYRLYNAKGIPPVRALIADFAADINTRKIDDQFMIGPDLMVAPFNKNASEAERKVYLPDVEWFDFHSGEKFAGGKVIGMPRKDKPIPVFVRGGALLPVAEPKDCVGKNPVFDITMRAYGTKTRPAFLFADDGVSFDFEKGKCSEITITVSGDKINIETKGGYPISMYRFNGLKRYV